MADIPIDRFALSGTLATKYSHVTIQLSVGLLQIDNCTSTDGQEPTTNLHVPAPLSAVPLSLQITITKVTCEIARCATEYSHVVNIHEREPSATPFFLYFNLFDYSVLYCHTMLKIFRKQNSSMNPRFRLQ